MLILTDNPFLWAVADNPNPSRGHLLQLSNDVNMELNTTSELLSEKVAQQGKANPVHVSIEYMAGDLVRDNP